MKPAAITLGAGAVAAGYVLAHLLGLPMLWFDSALGTWSTGARPSSAAMDFFGRSLWALGFGLAVALTLGRLRWSPRGAALLAAALIAGAFGFEVKRLISRVPVAEEYPSAYDPVTGRLVESTTRLAQP